MPKFAVTAVPQGLFFTIVEADDADAARQYAEKNFEDLVWASDEDLGPGEIDDVILDADGSMSAAFDAADEEDEDEEDED